MSESEVIVLSPVFNDWEALSKLLVGLDLEIANLNIKANILLVDDCSDSRFDESQFDLDLFSSISSLEIVRLKRNLGHQAAIALGLAYREESYQPDTVVLMDSDGQDDPKDLSALFKLSRAEVAELGEAKSIVFAERGERPEGFLFRIFYLLYRNIFRILTGSSIRFGNFCLVPGRLLPRLVVNSDLAKHFAGAVVASKISFKTIRCGRSARVDGESKMNYVSLVIHGLSAVSVFSEKVGVRLLMFFSFIGALALSLGVIASLIRLFTDLAVPGWATYSVGLSAILLFQCLTMSSFFVFLTLASSNMSRFLPARDFKLFVESVRRFSSDEKPL